MAEIFQLEIDFGRTDTGTAVNNINRLDAALDRVGKGATQAGTKIKSGLGGIGNNLFSGLQSGLQSVSNLAAQGTRSAAQFAGGLTPMGGALTGVAGAAGIAALGVAAVGAAIIGGAFAAGKMADEIQDLADSLQVSTDFLQVQQSVMILATGSADNFGKAMGKLNQAMGEALGGDSANAEKFAAIGVSLTNADGSAKSAEQTFKETTEALRGMENATQRQAAAQDIFGKSALSMAGYLAKPQEEIDRLEAQVAKYGVASAAAIQASGALGDGMDLLGGAFKAGIVNAFAPVANALGNLATKALPFVGEAFKTLGGVIDLVCGFFSVIGDVIGGVWDLLMQGVSYIGNLFPIFGKLGQWLNYTGDTSLSLRERWAITMGDMIKFAGVMVGRVAGFFAGLGANVHNIIARIKNALVDSGVGKLIGINGKMEIRDAGAASAVARGATEAAFAQYGADFTTRNRGAGNSRAPAESPGGGSFARGPGAGGGGGGSSAASDAAKAEADALKRHNDAVAKLNESNIALGRTEEENRLASELDRAGLGTDITQTNDRANAIRALVTELTALERSKRIADEIKDYEEAIRDASLSVEDLVRVEARRAAGLETNLAVTDAEIQGLEEKAIAAHRAKLAVEALAEAEDLEREARYIEEDTALAATADQDPVGYEAAQRRADINRQHQEEQDAIYEKYGREGEEVERLIALNDRLREARQGASDQATDADRLDEMNDKAEALADTMLDFWENPQEAMKRFFIDFLKNILMAIAKATILKSIMGESGGASGGGGSGWGAILKTAITTALTGGRATGGHTMAGGTYLVGEEGPEIVTMGGQPGFVTPNHALGGSAPVAANNNVNMNLTYNAAQGANPVQSIHDANKMRQMIVNEVREEMRRSN